MRASRSDIRTSPTSHAGGRGPGRKGLARWQLTLGLAQLLGTLTLCAPAAAREPNACLDAHAEGQQLRLAGQLLRARDQLLQCAQTDCPKLVSNECTTWLAEVDQALSTVVFAVTDPLGIDLVNVQVWSDGVLLSERADGRARPLDPGTHEFRFEAPGFRPLVMTLPMRQSEHDRIVRVQLQPASDSAAAALSRQAEVDPGPGSTAHDSPTPGRSIPLASYVLSGVALAGFVSFGAFGAYGSSEYDHAKSECAPSCSVDRVAAGRRAYLVADVGLGIGIAAAATALIVYLASPATSEHAPSAPRAGLQLQPGLSPKGAELRWTARY